MASARMTNWAENFVFSTDEVLRPTSVEQLQELVSQGRRLRPLGTAHSFNRVADTEGALISVASLPERCEIDPARREVTVSAGMRYGDVGVQLFEAGYALANLPSLPHTSVAGSIATATHGSGVTAGNLATAVTGLELVIADGQRVKIDRTDPDFDGCVVSLGALGVVTAVTLEIQPAVPMRQWIYAGMPRDVLEDSLDDVLASAYSVSLFLDWRSPFAQVWRKHRLDELDHQERLPPQWLGATLQERPRDSATGQAVGNRTEHFGEAGPSHLRLPHFRMDSIPSNGVELQSEYLLAREHALDAIAAIESIRNEVAPLTMVSEFRTVAADRLWLSPSYERDTVACHFTWLQDTPAVMAVLKSVEAVLEPFSPRPHWGKLFLLGYDELAPRYPRFEDFRALVARFDPAGKFRNDTLDGWFPPQ